MYANFLLSELKKWIRDPMLSFMIFYPLLLGLLGRFLLPWIYESNDLHIEAHADIILAALSLMTPLVFGAIIGFSILDDRDDNILTSVKVTPLSLSQFLSFKMATTWVFSFVAVAFVMWFADIGGLGIGQILSISFLASTSSPMTGLFINAVAKNKIEGFAAMKSFGIMLILPVISLLFIDAKELFFAIAPGFWPAKAISVLVRGEGILQFSFLTYYLLGLAYTTILNIAAYRIFMGKVVQ